MKSGYLRKNGVPYSEKATVTEYFQPTPETYGVRYMIVTTIIEDPEYLDRSPHHEFELQEAAGYEQRLGSTAVLSPLK